MLAATAILGAFQTIGDVISSGFKMAIEKDKEQSNRLIARNVHTETISKQTTDLATDVNYSKYIIYFLIFALFGYLLYTKKTKK